MYVANRTISAVDTDVLTSPNARNDAAWDAELFACVSSFDGLNVKKRLPIKLTLKPTKKLSGCATVASIFREENKKINDRYSTVNAKRPMNI